MSKDFDTTLSTAIDLAAAAAQTAGASAARARGRKRAMRKRIAVCTASAVLVAAGATTAFTLSSPHGGAPQKTAASPSASPNPSPSGTTGQSPSPSSGTKPPTPSNSPSSSPSITADPHKVVSAAWLTPDQLPFADTFHWTAEQAHGQSLNAIVSFVPKDTSVQAITVCGDPAQLLGRTIGAQVATYFAPPQGSGNAAVQQIFFFSDTASAQQAFSWLQSQYGPACMPGSGVSYTKTAGDGHSSAAWLSRKSSAMPPDLAPYNREFFVQRGSTIAYVSISSTNSSLPTAYNDAAQLSTIAAHLCVYGGPCD